MSAPFLATVTILSTTSGAQPKGGGTTHLAMITPLSGERPSHDLPAWEGPADPGFGIEAGGGEHPWWGGGRPARPDQGLPAGGGHPSTGFPLDPARPDNSLPAGGTQVPPEISNALPPPGGDLTNQIVVAVYVPGKGWTAKAYPPAQPK
jgi:hypothetical protein